jgi:hypothetical protein
MEQEQKYSTDEILAKIKKLMALRDRPSCQADVDNATARINEMLIKYNLSMMDVENHKIDDSGVDIQAGCFDEFQTPYEGNFAKDLLTGICSFNFCRLITKGSNDPMSKGYFTIFGKKHNIAVVNYMFNYCLNNIKLLFNDYWETVEVKSKKNMHKRGFYQGAVLSLVIRLARQKDETEQEVGKDNMLAVVKYNDAAVDEKVNEVFPNVGKAAKMKICTNTDALRAGIRAGEKLSLLQGLENNEKGNKSLTDRKKQLHN